MKKYKSNLAKALAITGIATLSLTVIVSIFVLYSAVDNTTGDIGVLITICVTVVGFFMGVMELAAAELVNQSLVREETNPIVILD